MRFLAFFFLLNMLFFRAEASILEVVQGFSLGTFTQTGSSGTLELSAGGSLSLSNLTRTVNSGATVNGSVTFTSDSSWPTSGCTVKLDVIPGGYLTSPQANVVRIANSDSISFFVSGPNKSVTKTLPIKLTTNQNPPSGTYTGFATFQGKGESNCSMNLSVAVPVSISFGYALSVVETARMDFGTIDVGTSSGVVKLSPNGTISLTSGSGILFSGTTSAGIFNISGEQLRILNITLPSSATLSNGTSTLTLQNFTANYLGTLIFPLTGKATLNIGASLNINANQQAGSYTGTYPLILNY